MKSQFARLVLSAAVTLLLGTHVVSAQDQREVAKIPFAFQASERTLPTGQYTVAETTANGMFRVYDAAGNGVFVGMVPEGLATPGHPKLTFLCDGSQRILSKIQLDSGKTYGVSDSAIRKQLTRRVQMATLISVALTNR